MPIPPNGWGAVESLIWDYKIFLEQIDNIKVTIVNTPDKSEIIRQTNLLLPDIIHIQYDDHWDLYNKFFCKKVIVTSHYGYLDILSHRPYDYYWNIFKGFISSDFKIHALSPSIQQMYLRFGCSQDRIKVIPNGANDNIFNFIETPLYPSKSIYLAKIDGRKRQSIYQHIECIDFVGNCCDNEFNCDRMNYLGEWDKQTLYKNLTNYSNLVLLSDGEAHPLVCCEALICGLGLVISEFAKANLDISLPWIDVIPNNKLNDIPYIKDIIRKNQEKSVLYRKEIREYGLKTFSWKVICQHYLGAIDEWFN